MTISAKDWQAYIKKLSALNEKAASEMKDYVLRKGFADMDELLDVAYGLATKYGEGSAALSAQMYDAVAELSGKLIEPAAPAETASYHEVAKTVQGVAKTSQNPEAIGNAVGRLVKRAGADTTLKNALRDGAEFAWIPNGDTCAFCITLASRGWQRASKAAIKGGHAEHIHNNCDCTYGIRFDHDTNVAGYDPDKYKAMYDAAEGDTPDEKINSMRRAHYAEHKDEINAQKRIAYQRRKDLLDSGDSGKMVSGGSGGGNNNHRTFLNSELPNGLPIEGDPNSIADKVDDNGKVLQRRVYGPDGMAVKDFDTSNHGDPYGHPTGAHKHLFDYSKRNPHSKPLPLTEKELEENSDIIRRGENYVDPR